MRIYTRRGDDGTTGLHHGGRLRKDDPSVAAYGTVDEAQSFLGLARAEAGAGSDLDGLLVRLERELWVLMADLATSADHRDRLEPGRSLVTVDMVTALEGLIDGIGARTTMPTEFVVPGQNRPSALLDVARTVVRRAERLSLAVAPEGSQVVPYLNRLSDLLWTMARWQEEEHLPARVGNEAGNDAGTTA